MKGLLESEGYPMFTSFARRPRAPFMPYAKYLGRLKGQDVFNFEMINKKMDAVLHGNPMTKASIDMAFYDIVGKSLNLPVYTLLGGAYSDRIELTMSIGVQSAEQMAS
jgi:L-alanine-DL-glutamate epimerase-like enolase superfamily enzyme